MQPVLERSPLASKGGVRLSDEASRVSEMRWGWLMVRDIKLNQIEYYIGSLYFGNERSFDTLPK